MILKISNKRIFVAGHKGMVGSALLRRLASEACQILTVPRDEVDLRDQFAVFRWFEAVRPQLVLLAAARAGGIYANETLSGEFIYDNLALEINVIEAARRFEVEKLVFLGSSCIYPRLAPQPIPEAALLTGPLEPTNQWYAIAKIAGLKLCEAYRRQYGCDFISVMPCNLYGPGDNFNPLMGHVIPALLVKMDEAVRQRQTTVELWGDGTARREFLHVDDLADAVLFVLEHWSGAEHINVGSGEDLTINDLAKTIAKVVGFEGAFTFDRGRPNGAPRKVLNVKKLHALGWRHRISLEEGIGRVYNWYLNGES